MQRAEKSDGGWRLAWGWATGLRGRCTLSSDRALSCAGDSELSRAGQERGRCETRVRNPSEYWPKRLPGAPNTPPTAAGNEQLVPLDVYDRG